MGDDEGRPRTNAFDQVFAGMPMTADDAALIEAMGGNGDGVSRPVSAFEKDREPLTVQYEGEHDDNLAAHAPPKKTQYDKIKGINPEEL